jgi:hypothetical protein
MSCDDGEVCAGHMPPAWAASYRAENDTQRLLLLDSPTIAQWVSPTVSPRRPCSVSEMNPALMGGACAVAEAQFSKLYASTL